MQVLVWFAIYQARGLVTNLCKYNSSIIPIFFSLNSSCTCHTLSNALEISPNTICRLLSILYQKLQRCCDTNVPDGVRCYTPEELKSRLILINQDVISKTVDVLDYIGAQFHVALMGLVDVVCMIQVNDPATHGKKATFWISCSL